MATATGNEILARARVIATQQGIDPSQSTVLDNLAGARALLNDTIRILYRARAKSQDFYRDITTRHTVTITGGTGTCPDTVMRELLHQADFTDANNALVTYYNFGSDYNSGVNFTQLGYVTLQGDNFLYTAPAPDLSDYDGNLFVTVATFPTLGSMSSAITFPTEGIIDDLCSMLAQALIGEVKLAV